MQPGLMDVPDSMLSRCLELVALEQPEHLANAVLACKALRQAGEAVPHRARLTLTVAKVHQAREGGREQQLLAWLTRKAHLWREAVMVVHPLADLRLLLGSLAASGRSGLRRLEFRSGVQEGRFRLPKVGSPWRGVWHVILTSHWRVACSLQWCMFPNGQFLLCDAACRGWSS